MRNLLILVLIVIATIYANLVVAEETKIYKTVHKDGTVTYSDQPSEGAVELSLDVNTNTIQSMPTPKVVAQSQIKQKKRDYQIEILSPQQDATVRSNNGQIEIKASIQATLAGFYQLSINQQVIDSASGLFVLENMDRGTYDYQVNFISNSGKVIASSEKRRLHLHRTSVLLN